MPRRLRLFTDQDLLTDREMAADAAEALNIDGKPQRDLDTAQMWTSVVDGLAVRGVKPHSAEKSRLISRGLDTVTKAMSNKWWAKKYGVQYLELYSGPGRLINVRTGKEEEGSPLRALAIEKPFTHYVFNDFTDLCVDALSKRVEAHRNVTVTKGDAKRVADLDAITKSLNPRALIVAFLDTARPQDLPWTTVRYLAEKYEHLDLIINLPVNSVVRAILGHRHGGGKGRGAAGDFLDHDRPYELVESGWTRAIEAVRKHYDDRLRSLGYQPPQRHPIFWPSDSPYYDVLYASRHPTGVTLWRNTNPKRANPQMAFDGMTEE